MIISCPECSGRFRIDPSALGAGGRKVRCSKCAHTWLQSPPDPEAEPAPRAGPDPVPAADPESAAVDEDVAADGRIDWDAPAVLDDDDTPVRSRRQSGAVAAARPTGRWPAVIAWAALAAVVGGLAAGLLGFRDTIMRSWPETAKLYDQLDMAQPGFGLVLAAPRTRETKIEGVTALVIEGRIENPTSRERKVPKMLRLRLLDENQRELQTRTFDSPVQQLMPEQSATYKFELKDPAEKRDILLISFVVEKNRPAPPNRSSTC